MGTDASHQADSSVHTAPLPTPAALSSDTPIAPTPEQVNKHGSEPRGAGRSVWPLPHGAPPSRRGSCHSWGLHSVLTAAPQVCVVLPVWEMRLKGRNSLAQNHTAHQRQSWDSSSNQSSSKRAVSCASALLQTVCSVEPFEQHQEREVPRGQPGTIAAPPSPDGAYNFI